MKIKSISMKFTDEGVEGQICYNDQGSNLDLNFAYDPEYGWQQWGAELDVLRKTVRILRLIFEENIEFVNDLTVFININR